MKTQGKNNPRQPRWRQVSCATVNLQNNGMALFKPPIFCLMKWPLLSAYKALHHQLMRSFTHLPHTHLLNYSVR